MNLFQQCLPPTLNTDYRYQADRRKVVTTIRPVPGSVRLADGKPATVAASAAQMVMMKPASIQSVTGGKENIPLSKKLSSGTNNSAAAEVVIDLCAEEEGSSRRTPPQKCSSTEPEVIDLCEESPIRRSVPSIAATLLPRKRKLDILREGGLEVTPVATAGGSSSVTISRRLPPASVAISAIKSGETSLEIIDPKKSQKVRSSRAPSQVLDLRTMRNTTSGSSGISDDEESVVKKFSPNLGPNIEISLVANDTPATSNGAAGNSLRRDEKKRKSIPLPIPALRKISTGELSVKNLTNNDDIYNPKGTSGRRTSSDVTLTKAPSKSSIPSTPPTISSAQIKDRQTPSLVQHVNPSLYLAAFYNSMFPESGSDTFISAHEAANTNNPYQIQLTQQQINYVKGAFMHQPGQEIDIDSATDAFAQKFTNMLKNGTVSIVENYEKILPD